MKFTKLCLTAFLGAFVLLFFAVIPNIVSLGVVGAWRYRKQPVEIVKAENGAL